MSILSISEILIIPDIVIIVALDIRHVFKAGVIDLLSGWPLEPLLCLHEHMLSEELSLGHGLRLVIFILFLAVFFLDIFQLLFISLEDLCNIVSFRTKICWILIEFRIHCL